MRRLGEGAWPDSWDVVDEAQRMPAWQQGLAVASAALVVCTPAALLAYAVR